MKGKKATRKWYSGSFPKRVTVRCTVTERDQLYERAGRARLSASRFLVRVGTGVKLPPISDRKPPTDEERKDLEFLLYELRKIGVNLNQIARASNLARLMGRRAPSGRIESSAAAVEALVRLIRKRL